MTAPPRYDMPGSKYNVVALTCRLIQTGIVFAACLSSVTLAQVSPAVLPPGTSLHDFDRDGVQERLIGHPGSNEIQQWNRQTNSWEKADYSLPAGVFVVDKRGHDAGLRFIDLNGDGFDDVLFSNPQRFAIHLWSKDVKPELGWTRGWSQFVKEGVRGDAASEPPNIVDAEVSTENGELIIKRLPKDGRPATVERHSLKELIAFDMPPPKSPDGALASFHIRPGFRVELAAAEPVVIDPIALDWGADGRLWVVEMRDYPLGLDGKGKSGGVVKVLDDTNGDGRYDKATIFLDGIPFPSSVMPWRKGVLIAAAPDLFYAEDINGDGRADVQKTLFTGFTPGNQQHRFNGFEYGLDGWIYAANGDSGGTVKSLATGKVISISGRDFRFRPDTGEMEAVSAESQFGRHRDDWGNWFGNYNAAWLWHVTLPEHYLRRNPKLAVTSVKHDLANYENSTRVFPASPAMVRPNQPWSLNHVTSACSPCPYRDDYFGPDFATSVFISEPVHNAVHREVLAREGAGFVSHRVTGEEQSEFLASTDNWFRPTTLKIGPDGALYIADMYRFVIEHPEWISPEMQARLDLRAGADKGRIYRVVLEGQKRRVVPNLAQMGTLELVGAIDSVNGWQRDTAQRLLTEQKNPSAGAALRELLTVAHAPQVRIQALATLAQLGSLSAEDVTAALSDPHPAVRCETLRQSERLAGSSDALFTAVAALAADSDASVRLQAAYSLGAWPPEKNGPLLLQLAASDAADDSIRVAIMTSLRPENPLFAKLSAKAPIAAQAATVVALKPSSSDRAKIITDYAKVDEAKGNAQHGQQRFQALCTPCHRLRGEGHEVGPDLGMVGTKPKDWLLNAILDPNQSVEPRYRVWTIALQTGTVVNGIVTAETANNIVLRLAGGVDQAVLRSEIDSMEQTKLSLMPLGFETELKPQDMADLLRWLHSP